MTSQATRHTTETGEPGMSPGARRRDRERKPPQRRIGMQVKLVAALLAIAMVPLVVAAVLIEQTAEVAHNFATNETAFLRPPLEKARDVYLELIATKRDLYYRQVALRLAARPEITALARGLPGAPDVPGAADGPGVPDVPDGIPDSSGDIEAALGRLLDDTAELHGIEVIGPGGVLLASRWRSDSGGAAAAGDVIAGSPAAADGASGASGASSASGVSSASGDWRGLAIEEPVLGSDAVLRLTFGVNMALQEDFLALNQALRRAQRIDEVRSALPSSYRDAFWMLVGGVILLVSLAGILMARRLTVRISALVTGTRRVAAGDLSSRVASRLTLGGRDELAELAWAFDRMVDELEDDREQIVYLQRVGAWQDVARKLAHEIKNPLTPIQLAVQQVVSSYRGDDVRYRRMLTATEEIVTEEIASLRRLVDAFRVLGQLPRVDAHPMDLGVVVEDLTRNPALGDHLVLHPPEEPVMVRGDRQLLRRVLANLSENGIHAGMSTGGPGKVVIRWHADHERERAVLTVDDEGPGVAPNMREKIFEPYVTGKEHGTGLGLTICKKIVLEHRGTLSLASGLAPTGGARFVLSLLLASADGEDGAEGGEDE